MQNNESINLIDGDIILYTTAFSCNQERDWKEVQKKIHNIIQEMVENTGTSLYMGFLQGTGNFRTQVDADGTPYKGNRKAEKPFWFQNIKNYLIDVYKFQVVNGMETDDALSILQQRITHVNTIICSADKDLLQVPGKHYNLRTKELSLVTPVIGLYTLALQILTGDATDNIKGLHGIGPVKAEKILDGINPDLYLTTVFNAYQNWYDKKYPANSPIDRMLDASKHFASTFQLVYLLQELDPEVFPTPDVIDLLTLNNVFNYGPGSNREPEDNKTMFD